MRVENIAPMLLHPLRAFGKLPSVLEHSAQVRCSAAGLADVLGGKRRLGAPA